MRVKFGLKIPNRLGKVSENLRGDFFVTHTVYVRIGFGIDRRARAQSRQNTGVLRLA